MAHNCTTITRTRKTLPNTKVVSTLVQKFSPTNSKDQFAKMSLETVGTNKIGMVVSYLDRHLVEELIIIKMVDRPQACHPTSFKKRPRSMV